MGRTLIGFSEISGYFKNLHQGFIDIGLEASYINNGNFTFNYDFNSEKNEKFFNKYIYFSRSYRNNPTFLKKIVFTIFSITVFIYSLIRYQNFIISPKSTLIKKIDIIFYRLFGKKVIYVSLGNDSRPPFFSGKYKDFGKKQFNSHNILIESKKIKKSVRFYEKFSNYFISYPQHAQFNKNKIINGMCIGFPSKINNDNLKSKKKKKEKIKILHAPSRPEAKGTKYIKHIIYEIIKDGYNIEFKELKNAKNSDVIKELANSDILIDQAYSDVPLAGIGVEAACFKIPVIVCGYYSLEAEKKTCYELIPPSIYIHPKELKNNIKRLCKSEKLRKEYGNQLFNFVKNNWSSIEIAKKYNKIIRDEIPKNWIYNIKDANYINGWGISEMELIENLKTFTSNKKRFKFLRKSLNKASLNKISEILNDK